MWRKNPRVCVALVLMAIAVTVQWGLGLSRIIFDADLERYQTPSYLATMGTFWLYVMTTFQDLKTRWTEHDQELKRLTDLRLETEEIKRSYISKLNALDLEGEFDEGTM